MSVQIRENRKGLEKRAFVLAVHENLAGFGNKMGVPVV
jgi:hypothetical protein